jgi:DNA replication protein DnaC
VNELVEAANDAQLTGTIARYGRVDLLIINELGYIELDKRGAELLFQVLTEREEKTSVAIATNQPFSEWTRTFTDPRLCAAIVDRLTFRATIIETSTESYRLAHARHHAKRSITRTTGCPPPRVPRRRQRIPNQTNKTPPPSHAHPKVVPN